MHEVLKMRLDLKEKKEWQPIAIKMDLGTMYMICCRFKKIESEPFQGGLEMRHTYFFDFKIQNFEGAVTFGINPKGFGSKQKKPKDEFDWTSQFTIPVTPFFVNNEVYNIKMGPFKKKLDEKTNVLDININVHPTPGTLFNPYNQDSLNNSRYIDSSLILRDGDDYKKVVYKPIKYPDSKEKVLNSEEVIEKIKIEFKNNELSFQEQLDNIRNLFNFDDGYGHGDLKCYPRRVKVTN